MGSAGWFPDPSNAARQRYYDGTQWTEHYHYSTNPTPLSAAKPQKPAAEVPSTTPPAGWYSDPDGQIRRRYWDGYQWTNHFTDVEVPEPKAAPWFVSVVGVLLIAPMPFLAVISRKDDNSGAAAFWVLLGGFFVVAIWWGLRSSAKRRHRQQLQDQNTALAINADIEDDAYRRGDGQRGMHGQFPPSA
ncbi:DUF2510 domain-containing protein [Mycolicibacterium sp. A43C]